MKIVEIVESEIADKVKIVKQKQIEKKTIFLGSEILRPGHRCFEVNENTLETKEAEYERVVNFNSPDTRSIVVSPECVYINALNKSNAIKVYKKGGRIIEKPFMSFSDIGFV